MIERDGKAEGDYATKEAAFEAAAGVASNAIKSGFGIRISVPEVKLLSAAALNLPLRSQGVA
jgi:hypothetical protein